MTTGSPEEAILTISCFDRYHYFFKKLFRWNTKWLGFPANLATAPGPTRIVSLKSNELKTRIAVTRETTSLPLFNLTYISLFSYPSKFLHFHFFSFWTTALVITDKIPLVKSLTNSWRYFTDVDLKEKSSIKKQKVKLK